MALTKGTNSYVTVAEANAYFVDRLDVSAWASADDAQRAQALITATSVLDDLTWLGSVLSVNQPLAFPRIGGYFDPRAGAQVFLDTTVPARVIRATYELAHHFLNNDGLQDDTGKINAITIGPITLEKPMPANLLPANVKKSIKPLLLNSGSNAWWRAN